MSALTQRVILSGCIVVCGLFSLFGTPCADADERQMNAAVRSLLSTGFERSSSAYEDAEGKFQQALAVAGGDPLPRYAMGIVAIQTRKLDRAADEFEIIAKARPTHWQARQGQIWALMMSREYEPVLKLLDQYSEVIAREVSESEEVRAQQAHYLGRVAGYLRAYGEDKFDKQLLDLGVDRISDRLTGDLLESFKQGEQSFKSDYDAQQVVLKEAEAQGKVESQERLEKERAELAEQKVNAEKASADAEAKLQTLQSEGQAALQAVNEKLEPLKKKYQDSMKKVNTLRQQLGPTAVQQAMQQLQTRGNNRNNTRNNRYNRGYQSQQQQQLIRDLQAFYQVQSEMAPYIQRQNAIIASGQKQYKKLERKAKGLKNLVKRLEKDQAELDSDAASGITSSVRRARKEAASFNTYLIFSPEEEKEKLLKNLL